jgi:2'-5' RNA ligase
VAGSQRPWRVFVAHPLPPSIQDTLQAQLEPYRRRHREARWTRPETWHLTLVFLAAVDAPAVAELVRLVDAIARQGAPYEVSVDEGGGRERRGDGVAWLGLSRGAGTLVEMADRVADGCQSVTIDGAPPKRTPNAHLTLARRADRPLIRALREQTCGPLGVSWVVDRLLLVRSQLSSAGAEYETLHEATL